jgi:hypothetical protein
VTPTINAGQATTMLPKAAAFVWSKIIANHIQYSKVISITYLCRQKFDASIKNEHLQIK